MNVAVVFSKRTGLNFDISEAHLNRIREALPDANVYFAEDPAELISSNIKAEILICWTSGGGHFICKDYCLYCADTLKWIFSLSAGMEGVLSLLPDLPDGIKVSNTKGIHAAPIAEHVLGYLLAVYRRFGQIYENQTKHRWHRFMPQELHGKTVCIVGLGSIGCGIAERCKALGMNVLGVKRSIGTFPSVDEVFPVSDVEVALAQSDVVVNVLPVTKDTVGFFDAARLSHCKKGALFVNVGRGQTVNTDSLTAALLSGQLGGAMLDAVDPEPLPAGHPLWDMENVLISPHMSAESPLYIDRSFRVFTESVPFYLAGALLPNELK